MMDASNIDGPGVRRRGILGFVLLLAAIGLTLWLATAFEARWLRLAAAPLYLGAALCLLQAREKV